jgi:gliding motility-associated-like protein
MKKVLLSAVLQFLWFLIPSSFAQKQANIWYLSNKQILDFNYNPPKFSYNTSNHNNNSSLYLNFASICDDNGKLIFYTDGQYAWNVNNELLFDGMSLFSQKGDHPMIVPQPGSNGIYYIFSTHGSYQDPNTMNYYDTLCYTKVSIQLPPDKGKIIQKKIAFHTNFNPDNHFVVCGFCSNSVFWLVIERNDWTDPTINTNRIYAYKIDANGLNTSPVITVSSRYGNPGGFKFSPLGNKIIFYDFNYGTTLSMKLADFNYKTGVISGLIPIPYNKNYGEFEFSKNGHYFYNIYQQEIDRFDASLTNFDAINNSKKVLFKSNVDSIFFFLPQLGPDGKIYFHTNNNYYGVIDAPEEKDCKLNVFKIKSDVTTNNGAFPAFVANFVANDSIFLDFPLKIGQKNHEVCAYYPIQIGGQDTSYAPSWIPLDYLDNAMKNKPVFKFTKKISDIQNLIYKFTINPNCPQTDSIEIKVIPSPSKPVITGSKSVCPGVTGVEYYLWQEASDTIIWSVEGGIIASGQGNDTVKINWGITNPGALVKARLRNKFGCYSETAEFKVRIKEELITETPVGDTVLCQNLAQNILYFVPYTNGSIYKWSITNGIIHDSIPPNKITVDWMPGVNHSIKVLEKSITRDTVCFGVSQPLVVKLETDTTALKLITVSHYNVDNGTVNITWNTNDPGRVSSDYSIYRRKNNEEWQLIKKLTNFSYAYQDTPDTGNIVYEYEVQAFNKCRQNIKTVVQRKMTLTGSVSKDLILLKWNKYAGWINGVSHYEIWRKLDSNEWQKMSETDSTATSFLTTAADGYEHDYQIKAIEKSTETYSWSNHVHYKFELPLTIPNVFTPNGDGINDTWIIQYADLHSVSSVMVYDKTGRTVFLCDGNINSWDGKYNGVDLPVDAYFYIVRLKDGQTLTGKVSIIRK